MKIIHKDFHDPAGAKGTEEEIIPTFRKVRDDIRDFCEDIVRQILA